MCSSKYLKIMVIIDLHIMKNPKRRIEIDFSSSLIWEYGVPFYKTLKILQQIH